jgi:esterase/lipase superfamily enzyme
MAGVRVFFATNRNYLVRKGKEGFGTTFNVDGVAALRFGYANFTADPVAPVLQSMQVYPDKKNVKDIRKTGGGLFMNDLRSVMTDGDKTDTLVFIHGFNVTFEGALQAGALLAQNLKVGGQAVNIVVFSWPSDGKAIPMMSYYSDREDARATGPALARAFLKFGEYVTALKASEYCQRCVHLLVHSMGAYVLRNSLQALMAKERDSLIRLFDQILLAAPDEDDDTFELDTKLRLLPRIGRRVTVYFNPRDKGLLVSDKTKGNPDRLGSDGPRMVDLIPKKIVSVDCRVVAGDADRFVEHSYYLRSRAMAEDMSAVLADEPSESFPNRIFVERTRMFQLIAESGETLAEIPHPAVPERNV